MLIKFKQRTKNYFCHPIGRINNTLILNDGNRISIQKFIENFDPVNEANAVDIEKCSDSIIPIDLDFLRMLTISMQKLRPEIIPIKYSIDTEELDDIDLVNSSISSILQQLIDVSVPVTQENDDNIIVKEIKPSIEGPIKCAGNGKIVKDILSNNIAINETTTTNKDIRVNLSILDEIEILKNKLKDLENKIL